MNEFTTKLINLYTMSQEELSQHVISEVNKSNLYLPVVQSTGGLVFIPKNPDPLILISHLDTVSSVQPIHSEIVYYKDVLSLSHFANKDVRCLGGDDRNGVHLMLELVEQGHAPTLIFPYDEEIGCVGTVKMINEVDENDDLYQTLQDNKFIIQIDRGVHGLRHNWQQEVVYYEESNPKFISMIDDFFIEDYGSFTDVVEWMDFLDIAGCNVGAGYKNEHTRSEQTNVSVLREQMKKVARLINMSNDRSVPFYEHESNKYNYYANAYEDDSYLQYQFSIEEWIEEMRTDLFWSQERYLYVPSRELDYDIIELEYYKEYVEEFYRGY